MTVRTVLIVAADADLRSELAETLGARGYKVLTADRFTAGRKLLVDWQPDVLVTTIRLHEHNGLHLAIVSRLSSVLTKTIVIGYADQVLETEARRSGALYLIDPPPDRIVAAVEAAIDRRERRWPRARANIAAKAANRSVRLLDLSYGGCRVEFAPGAAVSAGESFDLAVGGMRISAVPVWVRQEPGDLRVWCGAAVRNGENCVAWREFVDSALGEAIQ